MSKIHSNSIIIASAGSRKTTSIVEEALIPDSGNTLVLTYTNENLEQIKQYMISKNGYIPERITLMSWFTFLLRHCIKPYRNYLYENRIPNFAWVNNKSTQFVRESEPEFYFTSDSRLYSDKASQFAVKLNSNSNGKVILRIESIFSRIFVDEVQDLAGYDLDLIAELLKSKVSCTFVGDPRQSTYLTNCSAKNKNFKGINLVKLFNIWESRNLCKIVEKNDCYRGNQFICNFADKLYPNLSSTISYNIEKTGHDGIFRIQKEHVADYIKRFNPILLRNNKASKTEGFPAQNFGLTKGRNFDRVLIFPTNPMKKFLGNRCLDELKDESKAKLYVAVTRARYSVAFVCETEIGFREIEQYP